MICWDALYDRGAERGGTEAKTDAEQSEGGEDREWVLDETWPEEGAESNCGDEGADGEWPAWSALVEEFSREWGEPGDEDDRWELQ